MLTKGNFTRDEWNNLHHLFNISHSSSLCCAKNFSLISCTKTMAKRMQEPKEDNRIVAKSTPTAMNLAVTVSSSSSSVNSPVASKSPGYSKPQVDRLDIQGNLTWDRNEIPIPSSSQGWQKDALLDVCTGKPVATEKDQESLNYPETVCTGKLVAPGYEVQKPEEEVRREQETSEAEANLGSSIEKPCKYFLKGTCTNSLCEYWHPPECQFYKSESGCEIGEECLFPHWKVQERPDKQPKKGDDKSAVAIVKSVRQLSCVSQDTEPPESAAISRKGTKVLGPVRRVRFRRAALSQANFRENKGPSLGKTQVKIPHQRSPLRYDIWGQISRRNCQTRAMRPRRCVGTCQENLLDRKGRQSYILFAFRGVDFACRIHNK